MIYTDVPFEISDMIRVKKGEDYLYGIVINKEEIIYYEKEQNEVILVNLSDFCLRNKIEVCKLTHFDKALKLKEELVVDNAKKALGSKDYIDSESFAFMCLTGKELK